MREGEIVRNGNCPPRFHHPLGSCDVGILSEEQRAWFRQTVSTMLERAAREAASKAERSLQTRLRELLGLSE